jgi:hypothetical protein
LTGLEVKARSQAELLALPKVAIKREEAKDQAKRYAEVLKTRYGLTTITGFAVVALGLERIVYEEIRA